MGAAAIRPDNTVTETQNFASLRCGVGRRRGTARAPAIRYANTPPQRPLFPTKWEIRGRFYILGYIVPNSTSF